jgi:hypothetical protein
MERARGFWGYAHWNLHGSHDFTWENLGPKRASAPTNSEKRPYRAFFFLDEQIFRIEHSQITGNPRLPRHFEFSM